MLPTTVREKSFYKQEPVGNRGERSTRTWDDGYNFFDLPGDEFHGDPSAFSNLDATPPVARCGVPKCPIDVGVDIVCEAVISVPTSVTVDALACSCSTPTSIVTTSATYNLTACSCSTPTAIVMTSVVYDRTACACSAVTSAIVVAVEPIEVGGEGGSQGDVLEIGILEGEAGTQGDVEVVDLVELGGEAGSQGDVKDLSLYESGSQGELEVLDVVELGEDAGSQGDVE